MEKCSKNNSCPDNKNLYLSDLSKETQADSNSSILSNNFDKKNNVENLIPIGILFDYNTIGFKVVPLGADSKIPVVKSTNEIYDNPSFWTFQKIEQERYKFNNVATTFGRTYIKTENGRPLSQCLRH